MKTDWINIVGNTIYFLAGTSVVYNLEATILDKFYLSLSIIGSTIWLFSK